MIATTRTWLLLPGFTVMPPYSLSTTMFALGPTVKRSSFLVSAVAPVTRQVAITRPAIVLLCIAAIPLVRFFPVCRPLLNMIQRHVIKHFSLLVGVHQVLARVFVFRILFQISVSIAYITIYCA